MITNSDKRKTSNHNIFLDETYIQEINKCEHLNEYARCVEIFN